MSKNVDVELKGNILTMKIDLTKNHGRSASGKTIVIGTTSGNQEIEGPDGEKVFLGVNCYKK